MKLNLKQLVDGSEALSKLSKKEAKELTVKVFYSIAKNIGKIHPELAAFEKARTSLTNKYFIVDEKDEKKGLYLPASRQQSYMDEIEELFKEEVDLDIRVIPLTTEIIEKAGITPSDLFLLEWMFELPKEAE